MTQDSSYTIVTLTEKFKTSFEALVTEYLPGSNPLEIYKRYASSDGIVLLAVQKDTVLGCVFGWPTPRPGEYLLDGIAVLYHFWRQGLGSALLHEFQTAVEKKGFQLISLGSAGGFVEKFYLSNGFRPDCYKTDMDGVFVSVKEFNDLEDYASYRRPEGNGFVVMEKRVNHRV